MIKSHKAIKELKEQNLLILDGVSPKQISEVSVDAPLGQYIFIEESTLGLTEQEIFECTRTIINDLYTIEHDTQLVESYAESLRQKYYFRSTQDVITILNIWKRVENRIEKAGRVWLKVDITEPIILPRFTFFLAYLDQYIGTVGGSNIAMQFFLKSTGARHGLNHPLAGLAEPGYFSKLCVEIMPVVENFKIEKGDMVT